MSFLSTYQGMQTTLESSGLWRWLDGYLPAPCTTLHGHEKAGYNKCWFSEEGHRGYKKSGFHCRAKQGTRVINDLLCYFIKYQDRIWPWTSFHSLYVGLSANTSCYEFRGKHEIKPVWQTVYKIVLVHPALLVTFVKVRGYFGLMMLLWLYRWLPRCFQIIACLKHDLALL